MFNKIKNIFMPEETIVPKVVEVPAEAVVETPVEVVPEVFTPVDSSTLEVSANDWNITVSDREGNVVQKFNDITEAMKFARDNGYSLHAE